MTALKDTPRTEPEVLIEEARRRGRRRRTRLFGAVLAAALGAGIFALTPGKGPPASHRVLRASADRPGYPSVDAKAFRGDGNLAFVSLGALFVLDGSTGSVRQVPPLTGATSDPQFSPDRQWLAFEPDDNDVAVAAADGAAPHVLRQQSLIDWLPDGELVTSSTATSTSNAQSPDTEYRISSSGRPVPAGTVSADLMAWAPAGGMYVFDVSRFVSRRGGLLRGTNSIETATSLTGRRTVWKTIPVTVGPRASAVAGDFAQSITVLPHRQGLLVWEDPGHADGADGLPVYLIRSPGGPMRRLGIAVGTPLAISPRGRFSLELGAGRIAWDDKTVETCRLAIAPCTAVPTPRGDVSIEPAWSPDGAELAYVTARASDDPGFPQSTIAAWYATRTLWLLPAGAATARAVVGGRGAAAPIWSSDGDSLMFVKRDALWLVRSPGTAHASAPVRIASPLFAPGWPSYYGQVDWPGQFAWSGASG